MSHQDSLVSLIKSSEEEDESGADDSSSYDYSSNNDGGVNHQNGIAVGVRTIRGQKAARHLQ